MLELVKQNFESGGYNFSNVHEQICLKTVYDTIPNTYIIPKGNNTVNNIAMINKLVKGKNLLYQNAGLNIKTPKGNNRTIEILLYLFKSKTSIYIDAKYLSQYSETYTYFALNDFPQVARIKGTLFVYVLFGEGFTPDLINLIEQRKKQVQGNNIVILKNDIELKNFLLSFI